MSAALYEMHIFFLPSLTKKINKKSRRSDPDSRYRTPGYSSPLCGLETFVKINEAQSHGWRSSISQQDEHKHGDWQRPAVS